MKTDTLVNIDMDNVDIHIILPLQEVYGKSTKPRALLQQGKTLGSSKASLHTCKSRSCFSPSTSPPHSLGLCLDTSGHIGIKAVHCANLANSPTLNKTCIEARRIVKSTVVMDGPTQARGQIQAKGAELSLWRLEKEDPFEVLNDELLKCWHHNGLQEGNLWGDEVVYSGEDDGCGGIDRAWSMAISEDKVLQAVDMWKDRHVSWDRGSRNWELSVKGKVLSILEHWQRSEHGISLQLGGVRLRPSSNVDELEALFATSVRCLSIQNGMQMVASTCSEWDTHLGESKNMLEFFHVVPLTPWIPVTLKHINMDVSLQGWGGRALEHRSGGLEQLEEVTMCLDYLKATAEGLLYPELKKDQQAPMRSETGRFRKPGQDWKSRGWLVLASTTLSRAMTVAQQRRMSKGDKERIGKNRRTTGGRMRKAGKEYLTKREAKERFRGIPGRADGMTREASESARRSESNGIGEANTGDVEIANPEEG
ncbi:hypothetical protein FB451DRAFT_1162008 [Mycena latifolia]|nr:hypothetical protein FB451DRAFT_1162008 [Mycena latifolia]